MCRIAGIIDRSNRQLRQDVIAMRDAMLHGGPDADGVYVDEQACLALGHRRLSIIDLSDAGNQPMMRDHLVLSFNGEIYNYVVLREELKKAGYHFTTESDTEVIIRAYQHWGVGCFDRFRGMFALAIYDTHKSELILARDYAGIKPLYYYCKNNQLYFASEIRAFHALKDRWSEREDWKIFFLTYGFLPDPVTTLQDVHPLEKGSYCIFQLNHLTCRTEFFHQDHYSEKITSIEEAIQVVSNELNIAVERHLVADAPIGVFLSGGIDSSILTLLSKKYKKDDLHTLSLVFEDQQFSEQVFQEIVVERSGAQHQSFLVKKQDFEESLDDIFKAMDQPSTDGINSYFICKYARKAGLKAVLSGLGADELFGGYPSFKRIKQFGLLNKLPGALLGLAHLDPKDSHRKIAFLKRKDPVGEYLFYRGYFTPQETASLLGASIKEVDEALRVIQVPEFVSQLSDGNRVSYLESSIYMQSQLLKDTDVMSMWHGVEVRVPFLGRDLIKAVQSISSQTKFGNERSKYLLIESCRDILPREIWDRKKQGFVLPFSKWMKGKHLSGELEQFRGNNRLHERFNKGKLAWSRYWAYLLSNGFNKDGDTKEMVHGHKRPHVLFLNLTTFSAAGGIEKFNKCFLKSLKRLELEGRLTSTALSPYDKEGDERYYRKRHYRGFNGRKTRFSFHAIRSAANADLVVLGHLNLAPVGWMIRKMYPRKKIVLVAHGIEVWEPVTGVKKQMLQAADEILSVSNYTKDKLVSIQGLPESRIRIFPNTIDPLFEFPSGFAQNGMLRERYHIGAEDPVIYTLARLSSTEKYKGYDIVIECLPELKTQFPNIRYVIGGKYDAEEKLRIDHLVQDLELEGQVILTGYLPENELTDHYQMADLFIMPSRKEGFGIVFLEAMVCGLPVIGGNMDGSVDALRNGELGTLVDPESKDEIIAAIAQLMKQKQHHGEDQKRDLQQKTLSYFGFEQYKKRLEEVIFE